MNTVPSATTAALAIFAVGALTPSPATTSAAASRIAVRLSSLRGRAIPLRDECLLNPKPLRDECLLNHRRSLPQRQATRTGPAGSTTCCRIDGCFPAGGWIPRCGRAIRRRSRPGEDVGGQVGHTELGLPRSSLVELAAGPVQADHSLSRLAEAGPLRH